MLDLVKQLYENNKLPIFYFDNDMTPLWHNRAADKITAVGKVETLCDLCFLSNFAKEQEKLSEGITCRVLGNPVFGIVSVLLQPLECEQSKGIIATLLEQPDDWELPMGENTISSVLAQYRNPMFSIYNMLGPLKKAYEEHEDYENCDYIDRIGRMCYQTMRATNNLSTYFKYHAGTFECSKSRMNLNLYLEEACFTARSFVARTDIGFRYELCEDMIVSEIDANMLSVAFYNLIANSCLYTNPGNEIVVRLEKVGQEYLIIVSDKGVGIPEEVQPHIFEPFYSYDPNGSPAAGVGLGLSIVKRVAAVHQGSCMVTSALNEGTTVVLRLPIIDNNTGAKILESIGVGPINRFSTPYLYLVDICGINTVETI